MIFFFSTLPRIFWAVRLKKDIFRRFKLIPYDSVQITFMRIYNEQTYVFDSICVLNNF